MSHEFKLKHYNDEDAEVDVFGRLDTIANHFKKSLRHEGDEPIMYVSYSASEITHFEINGFQFDKIYLSDWYLSLWVKYFSYYPQYIDVLKERPSLIEQLANVSSRDCIFKILSKTKKDLMEEMATFMNLLREAKKCYIYDKAIAIIGDKQFDDAERYVSILNELYPNEDWTKVELIANGDKGVGHMTTYHSDILNSGYLLFKANWKLNGKSARYRRDAELVDYLRQHHGQLLAFWNMKDQDTKHVIDLCKQAGVNYKIISYVEKQEEE